MNGDKGELTFTKRGLDRARRVGGDGGPRLTVA